MGLFDELKRTQKLTKINCFYLTKKTEIATAATAATTAKAAAETGSYNHKILHKQTDRRPCPLYFLYSFKRKSP